jgi:hypothetical protein
MSADRSAAVSDPAPFLSPSGSVRLATCGWCWAATGQRCVTTRHGAPAARPGELAELITEVTDLSAADAAREAAEMLSQPAPRPEDGSHLARWLRAERRGLISREELAAALARVDVIAADVVILDSCPVSGPDEASGQLGTGPAAGGQR